MNVLMVISHLNIGGTETYILSMARVLRRLGIGVGVATMGGPLVPECRKHHIPVHIISSNSSPTVLAAALAKLAPSRYQIIQLHDSRSFMATGKIRAKCRVPVILTIHGTYHQVESILHGARHAQQVVPVSDSIRSWVRAKGVRRPLTMIPNGIDTTHFSPSQDLVGERKSLDIASDAAVLLHPARFDRHKQAIARKVIEASEEVAQSIPKLQVILIGPGPYRLALHEMAQGSNQRLGRTVIQVRPPTLDIRRYYRAADLVIASGRTVMEAMSCAKPVIASGIRGYEGILSHHNMAHAIRRGFGDHSGIRPLLSSTLAADIKQLMADPAQRQALGQYNRSVVHEQFAIGVIARQWLRIYRSLNTPPQAIAAKTPRHVGGRDDLH